MEDKTAEGSIEMIVIDVMIEAGIDHKRGYSQEVIVVIELEVHAVVGLDWGPQPVPIEIE